MEKVLKIMSYANCTPRTLVLQDKRGIRTGNRTIEIMS